MVVEGPTQPQLFFETVGQNQRGAVSEATLWSSGYVRT